MAKQIIFLLISIGFCLAYRAHIQSHNKFRYRIKGKHHIKHKKNFFVLDEKGNVSIQDVNL
jgi:hypothetical protein